MRSSGSSAPFKQMTHKWAHFIRLLEEIPAKFESVWNGESGNLKALKRWLRDLDEQKTASEKLECAEEALTNLKLWDTPLLHQKIRDYVRVIRLRDSLEAEFNVHNTSQWAWFTPWINIKGVETRIYTLSYQDYWAALGNRRLGPFKTTIEANQERRLHIQRTRKIISPSLMPGPVEERVEKKPKRRQKRAEVADVATVTQTYTFTAAEDAELVPAVATEDW